MVVIGQSMVDYVWQTYTELFPSKLNIFVCIDSVPSQKICNRCRIVVSAFHTQMT